MNPLVVLIIVIPLIGSAFTEIKEWLSIPFSLIDLIFSLFLYLDIPIEGVFYVTRLTWYFVLMVTSIYFLSSLFSIRYLKGEKTKISKKTYFVLLNFFASSMLFALVINNLGLMWVGIETTTITTILLVLTEGTETSIEASWRYTIIVSAGVTFAFISVILVYYSIHSLAVNVDPKPSIILALASGIGLVGFGTKVGVFPMNTWLPDAHSESPSPVSAMFSGVLLPVALYVLYRLYEIYPIEPLFTWAATISIFVASLMMASQKNMKRLFAYSTIENMNLALLGFALNQPLGAIILLVAHAFGKSSAFYTTGVIFKASGSKEIRPYGLWKLKYTGLSLLFSSLTVTGAPPLATFVGEFLILSSALKYSPLIFSIVIFSLAVAFISINYHVSKMSFEGNENLKEDKFMGIISFVTSLIPLIMGIALIWWLL
ncbi:oxidoreductase [Candidatus Acidianus copahuensis]|uniref:Oxidoreductase n=1 Tax=Candidatus Acidianus copahuensis TaxID=1160895 RepID=A0A031LS90_9CREN|nr:proton-conducting transporter membrane subunit [Candidatus Acidianus copahuensis]EZQ10681.1 oxidoreductase [Candidatus Acidianus copahuensis]